MYALFFGVCLTAGDILPPFCIAYVKGWRRATALLICLVAIKEREMDLNDLPGNFRVDRLVILL